jgi:UDP-N-acetylmuramate dehydrogenase
MFEENISLAQYSNYKIGGPARYFFLANGLDDLGKAIVQAQSKKLPIFILGGGTNLLIGDRGFDGLVIKSDFQFIYRMENFLTVGAGLPVADLLAFCAAKGLAGLEWAGGLPGTVGGAIRGNAGAFRGEIKDNLMEVASLKLGGLKNAQIIKRNREQCLFGYRDSVFKQKDGQEIIITATFQLRPGDPKAIGEAIESKIKWRQEKQPLDYPNIGSIFKNVDWRLVPRKWQKDEQIKKHLKIDPLAVLPTAALIDKCGLKGVSCGGAMISSKHPNFIVNACSASSDDVRAVIDLIKKTVRRKFDIQLEEEIIYV